MKISSLLCFACLLTAQFSAADDFTNSSFRGFQVPAAARNAAEAPPWNPQAQPAAPQSAIAQIQSVVVQPVPQVQPAVAQQPAQTLSQTQATAPTFTAPPITNSQSHDPRPLVSVMKRKTVSTPRSAAPTLATTQTATSQPAAVISTASPTVAPPILPPLPSLLTATQTAAAQPINSMPHPASEIITKAPATNAAPIAVTSPVRPAEYDEPVATSPGTSAADTTAAPTANNAADNIDSELPRTVSEPFPLQPTKGPVQFVAPPGNSISNASSIVDPQVTPANSNPETNETPADAQQRAAAHAAADLLAQSIVPGATTNLPGTWQPLSSAITGLAEQKRLATVDDYWRLSRAVSDYIWTTDELERLEKAASARVLIDNPMISTARAIATARVYEAQLNVAKAQQSLITLGAAPQSTFAAGILPADRPLVGPYHTYFQEIFADRSAPARARELDAALSIHLKIIDAHAAAVRSAMDAVHYAEEAHSRGETDIRTVLACHEDLHKQRRDFLNAVYNYNLDVAEYATTVTAPGTPDDIFVAMLIRPQPAERLSAIPDKPSGDPFSSGILDSKLRAPRIHNPRQPGSNAVANHSANDGWIATPPFRPIDAAVPQQQPAEASRAAGPPPVVNPVNPFGQQSDPFHNDVVHNRSDVGDRYSNRYNESH